MVLAAMASTRRSWYGRLESQVQSAVCPGVEILHRVDGTVVRGESAGRLVHKHRSRFPLARAWTILEVGRGSCHV